ncbi:YncE family protein [Streptomyces sp. NRRL F-5630]|uniref:YncE family protein n=1 Tax=Streptomyces sp. NRRL F-5630 TaxID=1463864 RepID=UPI003D74342E
MRTRTLAAATALAALISSAALTAAPSAAADSAVRTTMVYVSDVAEDSAHHHLFFATQYGIKVTDAQGRNVTTLGSTEHVADLQLSPDGRTLYAVLTDSGTLAAYDTASLGKTAEYPVPGQRSVGGLAFAGGRLWFSHYQGIGSVDLGAEQPAATLHTLDVGDEPSRVYSDPADPGALLVVTHHGATSTLATYDVTGASPVLRVSTEHSGNDARHVTFGAGGHSLLVGGGGPDALVAYRLPDLVKARTYPFTRDSPYAVAGAPDGAVAATTWGDGGQLHVFPQDPARPAAVRPVVKDTTSVGTGADSLLWVEGGKRLLALTSIPGGGTQINFLDSARTYPTTLTVSAPAKAARAKSLIIKGTLKSALALPKGTPLKVVRTDLDSPKGKTLSAKSLGTGGAFSFTDTPPAGGKVTYKISYAGDADHPAASASRSVEVSRATPALKLDNNKKVYAYGADVKFTAHLGSTYKNRTVELWADPYGSDKPNKLVKKAKVNSKGDLSATVGMTRDTKLTAKFTGDSRYAPKSVKVTAYAKAKVSLSLSKQYKNGRIGSHTYAYYHKNKDAFATTKMNYYKGRKQRLEMEFYYLGKWRDTATDYFALGTSGKTVFNLGHPDEAGLRFRIRAAYLNNSSGDNVNSTAYSPWKYLYFTK